MMRFVEGTVLGSGERGFPLAVTALEPRPHRAHFKFMGEGVDDANYRLRFKDGSSLKRPVPVRRVVSDLTWASRVKRIRRRMRLPLRAFSRLFPVNFRTVFDWEQGRSAPLPVYRVIIEKLEVEAEQKKLRDRGLID